MSVMTSREFLREDLADGIRRVRSGRCTTYHIYTEGEPPTTYGQREINMLDIFVREGGRIHLGPYTELGDTPLHTAYQTNNIRLVKFLLSLGANPNMPNKRGELPKEKYISIASSLRAMSLWTCEYHRNYPALWSLRTCECHRNYDHYEQCHYEHVSVTAIMITTSNVTVTAHWDHSDE
jgi:hypothetical protein